MAQFKDNGKIASWAKSYVDEMRMYGIVAGDNNGNFNPNGNYYQDNNFDPNNNPGGFNN